MYTSIPNSGSKLPKVTADISGKQTRESEADWEGHLPTLSPAGMHTITTAYGKRSRAR